MTETPRYRPPKTGIHVCSFDEDEERSGKFHGPHVTEFSANIADDPTPVFDALRRDFEAEDTADLLVDLFIGGSLIADFWMHRQMLNRFTSAMGQKTEDAGK